MKTKEEKMAAAKIMLEALGLTLQDFLESNSSQDFLESNSSQDAPKFLDIKEINGVPCMYLFYNKETTRHEWLCLEIPNEPEMPWKKGRNWCQSKGGDYGRISPLKFISERISEINQVLENKGYPLVEYGCHWSTENYSNFSWLLFMINGDNYYFSKYTNYYVRAVVSTK